MAVSFSQDPKGKKYISKWMYLQSKCLCEYSLSNEICYDMLEEEDK